MMKRTEYTFDLPVVDHMDRAEYAALVRVINEMNPDGHVTGESIKSDLYQVKVEMIEVVE